MRMILSRLYSSRFHISWVANAQLLVKSLNEIIFICFLVDVRPANKDVRTWTVEMWNRIWGEEDRGCVQVNEKSVADLQENLHLNNLHPNELTVSFASIIAYLGILQLSYATECWSSAFTSVSFRGLQQLRRCNHIKTTAWNPTANVVAERSPC